MALNIKDPDTDRLARRLAELTGESITTSLREAIEARIAEIEARNRAASATDHVRDLLDQIAARGRARSVLNDLSEDEILGYDEHGLPS